MRFRGSDCFRERDFQSPAILEFIDADDSCDPVVVLLEFFLDRFFIVVIYVVVNSKDQHGSMRLQLRWYEGGELFL